ncbi:protein EFFECTOR OF TRANSCRIPTION 2-like isoform X2 [Ananas comosus]|uniref:Protein EFFECTOR OF TRANSCRIPTION 2-like isoform X2 n=1 Tax=Ananas comosus TaxID=4615 RepID=A0A6P5ERK5_ANACO|nr:protein EFFECTOR OF TRANSCRIPTION 2-like isoform X2 [Ananas comosus]
MVAQISREGKSVLIGPSDWEDHLSGKDGVQRYRIHNLPANCSCPGLYELGVATTIPDEGRWTRKHDLDDIVVVYLGQADNLRTRLQHYGRTGSHLDYGNSLTCSSKNGSPCFTAGPGLFREIFSKGYSLVFRWVQMTNKVVAERAEAKLLEVFDYAWNKLQNGAYRREEILAKLDNAASRRSPSSISKLQQFKHIMFDKKVGIGINENGSVDTPESFMGYRNLLPQVLKFGNHRPQSVRVSDNFTKDDNICGMPVSGGAVCRNRPVQGRKRCDEHKGKRIPLLIPVIEKEGTPQETSSTCGFILEDGTSCMEIPVRGRKRCELHRGRRIVSPKIRDFSDRSPFNHLEPPLSGHGKDWKIGARKHYDEHVICGIAIDDNLVCTNKPVQGRKRCELHKGRRIT